MREALLRGKDWASVAAQQKRDWFGADRQALTQSRMRAMLEAFDFMADMMPSEDAAEKVCLPVPEPAPCLASIWGCTSCEAH